MKLVLGLYGGARRGPCPSTAPAACAELLLPTDTVNLKPDPVYVSRLLLPPSFSKDDPAPPKEAWGLLAGIRLAQPGGGAALLSKLASVAPPQGNTAFDFAWFQA